MSAQLVPEGKEKTDFQEAYNDLMIEHQELLDAYSILRSGVESAMQCRDLVLTDGTQKNILRLYELLDQAVSAADRMEVLLYGERTDPAEKVWCSTCKKYLTTDAEKSGHCLVCFSS